VTLKPNQKKRRLERRRQACDRMMTRSSTEEGPRKRVLSGGYRSPGSYNR